MNENISPSLKLVSNSMCKTLISLNYAQSEQGGVNQRQKVNVCASGMMPTLSYAVKVAQF